MALKLIFFLLLGLSGKVFPNNIIFKWNKLYDGLTCAGTQILFQLDLTKQRCMFSCGTSPLCAGIFYHAHEESCVGCSAFVKNETLLHNGTQFFERGKFMISMYRKNLISSNLSLKSNRDKIVHRNCDVF